MFKTLHRSKQISVLALDRLSDYLGLMRIELKMQKREIGMQLFGYLSAALCSMFALFFMGVAVILSFWDSAYRGLAAWAVVALYMAAAGIGIGLARHHSGKVAPLQSLREELRRDMALVRESL